MVRPNSKVRLCASRRICFCTGGAHQRSALLIRLIALITICAGILHSIDGKAHESLGSQCETIAEVSFAALQDAPTAIIETKQVAPTNKNPGYCQISGYVAPSVGFLLELPLTQWNNKFLQLGCGGSCGSIMGLTARTNRLSKCDEFLRRGYACVISDDGHVGHGSALWAYDNLEADINFAYRAVHVTALAARALIEKYYGRRPKKSYFWGCSSGGREALMEAQRFPWDFDGIIAGDPSIGVPGTLIPYIWAGRALKDQAGRSLFTDADLDTLHRAVVAKCDLNDGVKDGLIGDPRQCDFDISTLLCNAQKRLNCLSAQQIEAARKVYGRPVTSQNVPIYVPVALKGSEKNWPIFEFLGRSSEEALKYIGFDPKAEPMGTAGDFDFDRDYKRLGLAKALYASVNPDLRQFRNVGGKLISYVGWATFTVPLELTDYYETVERTMGGPEATRDFLRLFAIPGMNHCIGGEGAFAVDWLSYLEIWIEEGKAPDRVLGAHLRLTDDEINFGLTFPFDQKRVEFTRPIYPYPTRTRYKGSGDPSRAENFVPENDRFLPDSYDLGR